MSKHGIVHGKGVNDMPRGWTKADEYNERIYRVWHSMIQRCYSEKYHEKQPTYKNCYCCERWLKLSNFVEDVKLIPNYEYWRDNPNKRISLDKDIKPGSTNKCYCLDNCIFTSQSDNTKQAMSTRDYEQFTGEKHPMYGRTGEKSPNHRKIVLVDEPTKQIVFTWQYQKQATEFFGISIGTLNYYLKGKSKKGHLYNGFLWYYEEDYKQMKEDD